MTILLSLLCFWVVLTPTVYADNNSFDELRFGIDKARALRGLSPEIVYLVAEKKKAILLSSSPLNNQEKLYNLHAGIEEIAYSKGIPESLLAIIVAIESGGRPCSRSKADARGLAQLMPQTFEHYKPQKPQHSDIFDPFTNLSVGADVIRDLLSRNEGLLAAAAYNAGEGILSKPWHKWSEETRHYIELVSTKYPNFVNDQWKTKLPKYIVNASEDICLQSP